MNGDDNGHQWDFPEGGGVATLPPPSPSGPVVPRRTVWLDLPAEYGAAGMKLQVWINYPAKLGEKIGQSEEFRDLTQKLTRMRQRLERSTDAAEQDRLDEQIARMEDDLAELTARDEKARIGALNRIVTEHNGWIQGEDDAEPGRPYPPANTPEFWDVCSAELSLTILTMLGRAIQELPLSVGRNSRSGRR